MASTPFVRSLSAKRESATRQALPADVRWMRYTANSLFVLAALLLGATALHLLTRQPVFALRAIRIEGDLTRNSAATIRVNAVPKLRGNFFTTDLQADQRAFESVPWVRHAVVQRIWPNRLAVRLEEHRPAALWRGGGASDQLVNTLGEVFEASVGDVEEDGLPALEGPDGSSAAMLSMLVRLQSVFGRLDRRVDALRLSGRASWRAELDSGAKVELGRGSDDEVVQRAEHFVGTLSQVTEQFQAPLVYADLRHRDGYALRLRGITTTLNPGTGPGAGTRN
ncbi:MAG: cell division protein FtsQ/DivIB [Burkholderiaceae bacterium]|nr:cell division protein FtsQ/DivIB [Burkholderiaceae bacterium]